MDLRTKATTSLSLVENYKNIYGDHKKKMNSHN